MPLLDEASEMPDKDEIRIRKATNLYDLLDDGIANNSDIPELVRREDSATVELPAKPMQRISAESGPTPEPVERKARSWFGIVLGSITAIAGSVTVLHPAAMFVWHDRMRRPSFFEYVSVERARGYAICVAIFGLLLLAYSLIKMPIADKKSRD